MAAFEESDCCGNGCANCVLDAKPQARKTTSNKMNILDNYSNFMLKSKNTLFELNEVMELHFKSSLSLTDSTQFVLDVPSGKHLMMRSTLTETNGKRLLRTYSPFWVDKEKLEFKLLVNLAPNGAMSKYIAKLAISDNVEFRGPIGGDYTHDCTDTFQNLVLISQGVAIAPTLPIIEEILENDDDMTRIFQMACFTDLKHAYFRKELQEFNKFWNYKSCIYLSRQICENIACLDNKTCIPNCVDFTKKLLYKEKAFIKRLNGTEILKNIDAKALNITKFVVCGSRNFQEYICNELKNIGFNISKENLFLL